VAAMNPELATAIIDVAKRNNWDPVHLGTVISYETGGTMDPWKAGPTTQWGQHRGLIQWGEPQAKEYGVTKDTSVTDQMLAVERYLKDRGLKSGAGLMDMYSTVNAGSPGLYNRSDAANGGAPGTVADKVNTQMAGHAANAARLLGGAAPVGALATGAPVDPTNPTDPTQSVAAPAAPLSLAASAAAPVGSLASSPQSLGGSLGGGASGQAQQPAAPDFLAPQQIQAPIANTGQSAQIAAALAKAYGFG